MTSTEYLQTAKIEELASRLTAEGYRVAVEPSGQDMGYDLVAEKGSERLAIEVQARSSLKSAARELSSLRKKARKQGYDFRLVVVSPPRETKVEVAGLVDQLRDQISRKPPTQLRALPARVRVERVALVDIDSVAITPNGVRLRGDAVVVVEIEESGGDERDGMKWNTDFPFDFDLLLDRDLQIEQVYDLQVDTSSFDE
jgi:Holliday junction resolvase